MVVSIARSFSLTAAGALATNDCSLAMQRVLLGFLMVTETEFGSSEGTGAFLDCFRRGFVER